MAFWGEKEQVLDGKNRLTFPSVLREQIKADADLLLTRGLDRCISIYTVEKYNAVLAEIKDLPRKSFGSKEKRYVERIFSGGTYKVKMDKQFRVVIPEHLKAHAGLKKDVVILGVDDRFEIWDAARWREELAKIDNYEKFAEDIYSSHTADD